MSLEIAKMLHKLEFLLWYDFKNIHPKFVAKRKTNTLF